MCVCVCASVLLQHGCSSSRSRSGYLHGQAIGFFNASLSFLNVWSRGKRYSSSVATLSSTRIPGLPAHAPRRHSTIFFAPSPRF